jgi:hypothetical protein
MDILAERDIISDVILAGGDVIMQTPDGDIQVNQIQSSSNIRLITEEGSIKDTSEDNTVALTGEGVMTLIASRNVNMRIADGSKIIARSTNEGSIHIQSPGDISIQSLETTDGDIYVKADGNIQALNMTTGDLGDNEPLVLSLSSKEKIYTGLIKADDYVYINADKIEHQLGSITAKQAVISAWNGIGTESQSLKLNVNQLDAATHMSGDIYIHNLGDLELTDLTGMGQSVNNVGGGEIRTDGQLTITDPLKQLKNFALIAENMIINSDLIHQSNGRIELTTVNTLEHRSGTIQALSNITMNTGRIIQTGGTISTNRLEILSSDTAQFESLSNEIGRLNATIETGNFSFVHAGDLFIDRVKADNVNLTSINGSILADGNRSIIDIDSMNVEMTAANEIKDINFANQASITATGDKISLIADKDLMLVNLSASQISVNSNQQLAVGQLTANEVDLKASQINQIDGQIRANQLQLNTLYGAGTETNYLETQVTLLDVVNQYSGDIYISNIGQLILKNLNDDNRAIDNIGGGRILTDDSLIITSEIQQSNDFIMKSQKDLTIDANVINIGGNTIELVSDAALIQQSGILLNDGGKISLKGKSITQQSGELLTGILEMIASDAIDLTKGSNNADILKASASSLTYKDQNEIMIQEIHTSNDINLVAESISDHADDELVDMTSDNSGIHLHAASISGIELADESNINIQSTGDIQLSGIGKLTIENIQAIDQEIDISATGDISFNSLEAREIILTASGDIQSNENANDLNADNIRLDATGAITGATGAINIADGARIWAKSVESDVQLHGAGEITLEDIQAAKDVKISADSRMIANRISAQNIDLSTSDALEAGQITASNEIHIQSENIISSSQNPLVSAQSLILKTKEGIGTEDNSFKTSVEQLAASNHDRLKFCSVRTLKIDWIHQI